MGVPRVILGLSIIILLCNLCVGQEISTTQGHPLLGSFLSMNNMRMKLGGLPEPPPLPPMLMDAGSSTTEKPNIGMNIMDEKRLNMRGPLDFATQIAMVDPPMTLVDPMSTFPSLNLGMTAPHDEMQPPMARPMPFPGSTQFPMSPPDQPQFPGSPQFPMSPHDRPPFPGPPRFPMSPPDFRPRPAWQDDDDDDDDCPFQNLGSMLPMFFPEFMHIGRVFNPVFGAPRLTSFFFRGPMFSSLLAPLMLAPSFGFGMGHGGRGHGGRGHGDRGHGMRTTYNPRYHKSSEESDEHSDLDDDYKSPFDDSEEEEDPEEEDSYEKEDDIEEAEEEDEGNIAMDKNKYNGRKKQGQNGENMKPNLHAGKFLSPGKAKYSAPETCQSFSFSSSDMCCEMPERPLISKKMAGKCGDASNMRFLTKYLMNKFQNGNERLVFDKNSANPPPYADAMKFVTCMFKNEGLLDGNQPSQKRMITAFTKNLGNDFEKLMNRAVPYCVQQIKKMNLPTWIKIGIIGNELVNPLPLLSAQCVIQFILYDCPESYRDESCDMTRRDMLKDKCDIFKPVQAIAPQKGGFMKKVEQTIKDRQMKKG